MLIDRVGIGRSLVTEDLAALFDLVRLFHQHPLVVVPDLVAEMTEHRPVRLAEGHPKPFAVSIQRFGQIDGDDAIGLTDRHLLVFRREQIETQPAVGFEVRIDRQPQRVQLDEHPALGLLGLGEPFERVRVVVIGPHPGEPAGEALIGRAVVGGQPVAVAVAVDAGVP